MSFNFALNKIIHRSVENDSFRVSNGYELKYEKLNEPTDFEKKDENISKTIFPLVDAMLPEGSFRRRHRFMVENRPGRLEK